MLRHAPSSNGPRLVLAAGLRTPFVPAGGAFRGEDAGRLGALVTRELLARHDLDPAAFDELVAGCVGPPFDQANVGRVIALRAGLPRPTPARTVARNCASGIESVTCAVSNVLSGLGDAYLSLGVEVMSAYPLVYGPEATAFFTSMMKAKSLAQRLRALASFRPRFLKPRVSLLEGLTDPVSGLIMGRTAEVLARDWKLSREECDRFALESHRRAREARESGRLAEEIVPVVPQDARSGGDAVHHDGGIRDDQTMEALAKLKPYFEKPDGIVTVGNSCGVTDGAVALIVATEERARALGLRPLAAIRAFAWAGLDPARMGLGPVYASAQALDAAGVSLADVDVVELNEAFAAQVLACARAFESEEFARDELGRSGAVGTLDLERTNVRGGAIALGHPVGATGGRLLLTLAHELRHRDGALGLATLCIGGGQGGAVVLERLR